MDAVFASADLKSFNGAVPKITVVHGESGLSGEVTLNGLHCIGYSVEITEVQVNEKHTYKKSDHGYLPAKFVEVKRAGNLASYNQKYRVALFIRNIGKKNISALFRKLIITFEQKAQSYLQRHGSTRTLQRDVRMKLFSESVLLADSVMA